MVRNALPQYRSHALSTIPNATSDSAEYILVCKAANHIVLLSPSAKENQPQVVSSSIRHYMSTR